MEKFFPHPHATPRKAAPDEIEALRDALYAAKIVAYGQGFEQMAVAGAQYGWRLISARSRDLARGLHHPRPDARPHHGRLRARPLAASLLLAEHFRDAVALGRRRVAQGCRRSRSPPACPTPAFSSTLAYSTVFAARADPTNLLQGLRDSFGAAHLPRLDKAGVFHTAGGRTAPRNNQCRTNGPNERPTRRRGVQCRSPPPRSSAPKPAAGRRAGRRPSGRGRVLAESQDGDGDRTPMKAP